eukprot:GHVS01068668.1.p1 GENE.GHVS01068668.1~~GHVS01068668.1.p1  ORF type:complete len:1059 (+),score=141.01 GHVS01068668.1:1000-4176(+)
MLKNLLVQAEKQIADLKTRNAYVEELAATDKSGYRIASIAAWALHQLSEDHDIVVCRREISDLRELMDAQEELFKAATTETIEIPEVPFEDITWIRGVFRSQARHITALQAMLDVAKIERDQLIHRLQTHRDLTAQKDRLNTLTFASNIMGVTFADRKTEMARIESLRIREEGWRKAQVEVDEIMRDKSWNVLAAHSAVIVRDCNLKFLEYSFRELLSLVDQGLPKGETCTSDRLRKSEQDWEDKIATYSVTMINAFTKISELPNEVQKQREHRFDIIERMLENVGRNDDEALNEIRKAHKYLDEKEKKHEQMHAFIHNLLTTKQTDQTQREHATAVLTELLDLVKCDEKETQSTASKQPTNDLKESDATINMLADQISTAVHKRLSQGHTDRTQIAHARTALKALLGLLKRDEEASQAAASKQAKRDMKESDATIDMLVKQIRNAFHKRLETFTKSTRQEEHYKQEVERLQAKLNKLEDEAAQGENVGRLEKETIGLTKQVGALEQQLAQQTSNAEERRIQLQEENGKLKKDKSALQKQQLAAREKQKMVLQQQRTDMAEQLTTQKKTFETKSAEQKSKAVEDRRKLESEIQQLKRDNKDQLTANKKQVEELANAKREQTAAKDKLQELLDMFETTKEATNVANVKEAKCGQQESQVSEANLVELVERIKKAGSSWQALIYSSKQLNQEQGKLGVQTTEPTAPMDKMVDDWKKFRIDPLRYAFVRLLTLALMADDNIAPQNSCLPIAIYLAKGISTWLQRYPVELIDCFLVGSSATGLFVKGVSDIDIACNMTDYVEAATKFTSLKGEDLRTIMGYDGHMIGAVEYMDTSTAVPKIKTVTLNITIGNSVTPVDVVLFNSSDGEYLGLQQRELVNTILYNPMYNTSIRMVVPVLKSVAHLVKQAVGKTQVAAKSMSSFGLVIFLQSVVDNILRGGNAVITSQSLLRTALKLISSLGERQRLKVDLQLDGMRRFAPLSTYEQDVPLACIGMTVMDPSASPDLYYDRISRRAIEEGLFPERTTFVWLANDDPNVVRYQRFKFYQAITKLIEEWLLLITRF